MANSQKVVSEIKVALDRDIEALLPEGGKAVVCLSGGVDSSVLLDLVVKHAPKNVTIYALHVDHGVQEDSKKWALHCEKFCQDLGVTCQTVVSKVDPNPTGFEERARKVRQKACKEHDADVVLMGHHADDQVETVMLRMFRGSGVHGLAAIRRISVLADSTKPIYRPLLDCWREQIEEYASLHNIQALEDPFNSELNFNRNWLRHVVIPEAEKRFPGAKEAVMLVARQSADSAALLDALADEDDQRCLVEGKTDRQLLVALGESRVRSWIKRSLQKLGHGPARGRQLAEAAAQLCSKSTSFSQKFGQLRLEGNSRHITWFKDSNLDG